MDEIQAYFAGHVTFDELSEFAQRFVTTLHAGNVTSISRGFGIIDRSQESDRHGPFVRVTWMLDLLSGEDRRWVGVEELTSVILDDINIAEWVRSIARSDDPGELHRVVLAVVDTWCSMLVTDELDAEFAIELSFDENGPVWRTIHRPNAQRTGIEQQLLEHLVITHHGQQRSDVEGRAQVTLPEFEVFIGRDSTSAPSTFTLTERPVVASVLVGTSLHGERWRSVVEEWVNAPDRPDGFVVEIHAGDGFQVWVDTVIESEPLAQLDQLIANSLILRDSLRIWDAA